MHSAQAAATGALSAAERSHPTSRGRGRSWDPLGWEAADPEGSGEAETCGPSPKVHVLSPRALLGGDVLQCGDWT